MPRVQAPHRRAGAQLRITEGPADAAKLGGDEAIVELDIMGDEDRILHERLELVGHVGEVRRRLDHGR